MPISREWEAIHGTAKCSFSVRNILTLTHWGMPSSSNVEANCTQHLDACSQNCHIPQHIGGCSLTVRNEGTCTTSYDEVSRISNHPPLPPWAWSATCTDSPCFSITLCNSDTKHSLWWVVNILKLSGLLCFTGTPGVFLYFSLIDHIHL